MDAKASARYLRGSAQKARLVVDMIRGKNINQALAVLQYTNKRAAANIEACVRSAIANATEAAEKANVAVDPDDLWVKHAFVDEGPSKGRYRMRPAPQGRAFRERRHFCHVTVMLSSDDNPAKVSGAGKRRSSTSKSNARDAKADGGSVSDAKKTRGRKKKDETTTSAAPSKKEAKSDAASTTDAAPAGNGQQNATAAEE
ncbi:MAG: 50S ribosomal protein L22 [Pyrinomonadaceae bacterium]|nr:50S ribosomal protein L22 [Pyrinomonadaceae bacterium]